MQPFKSSKIKHTFASLLVLSLFQILLINLFPLVSAQQKEKSWTFQHASSTIKDNMIIDESSLTYFRGENNLKILSNRVANSNNELLQSDDIYRKFKVGDVRIRNDMSELILKQSNNLHNSNPFIPLLLSKPSSYFSDRNKKNIVRNLASKLQPNNDIDFIHILFKCKSVERGIERNENMNIEWIVNDSSHLSRNVFSMRANLEILQKLIKNDNVEWIGRVDPIFKFDMNEFTSQELQIHGEEDDSMNESKDEDNSSSPVDFIALNIILERNQKVEQVGERVREMARWFNDKLSGSAILISKVVEHSETLTIVVNREYALVIAYEIAKLSSTLWLEPAHTNYEMNKYSKRITNYGLETPLPQNRQYFDGLTGQNEIVTVVDGTFDVGSCFFYDPNVPVQSIRYLNQTNVDFNSPHRKIKMHFGLIDNNTIDYDHGTHVSTSVAGYSTISDLYDYRGMAPNAKLALVQLGCQNPLGCTCDLVPGCACLTYPNATCPQKKGSIYQPTEPHKSIHYFTYELMKSRIQTNSWGGGTYYSAYAMYSDRYIWEHKDFLILFSAGNSGNDGFKTIGAQAQSKNGLAVGASHNSFEARREHELIYKQPPILSDLRKEILSGINCTTNPLECNYFTNEFTNVCAEDGYCKKSNASYSIGNCGCAVGGVGDKHCGRCVFNSLNVKGLQTDSMASFSSRGPTPDLRIKPDVNAPGADILSGRSYSTTKYPTRLSCPDTYKSPVDAIRGTRGTSMATPTTAGLSALVREYYREGYYPSGKKTSSDGFIPSSALLKASIINSGVDLKTVSNDYLTFARIIPRTELGCLYQGFGRVQLDQVLSFEESKRKLLIGRAGNIQNKENLFNPSTGASELKVEFGDPVIDSIKTYHYYYIKAVSENVKMTNVKITLVWADYPGSPAASSQLINDLDLMVWAGNKQYYGNSQLKGNDDGSTPGERDFRNNVEQVWVDESAAPGIVVKVSASYIFLPQSYALVITGQNIQLEKAANIYNPSTSISDGSRAGKEISIFALLILCLISIFFINL